MIEEYLLKVYGYNEPIFVSEIKVKNMSENAVRQSIKRLYANGFLKKCDTGIYYIPMKGKILKTTSIDSQLVINRKYIDNKSEIIGYVTGIYFAYQLGLTTQMPATVEIVTNKESTNGRYVSIVGQSVYLKKSNLAISKDNADILQLLDIIPKIEKYTELSIKDTINKIKNYIKQKQFTRKQLSDVSSYITGKTAKILIEWGLIYEFI